MWMISVICFVRMRCSIGARSSLPRESLGKEKIALESSVKVISLGDSAVGKSK